MIISNNSCGAYWRFCRHFLVESTKRAKIKDLASTLLKPNRCLSKVDPNTTLTFENNITRWVNSFKFIGCWISFNNDLDMEVTVSINIAKMHLLLELWTSLRILTCKYNLLNLPVLGKIADCETLVATQYPLQHRTSSRATL